MILKYILKNFSRRKVRTILMILSLLVSTGLIVTMSATVQTMRQSNVDLIASASGRYDLAVSKVDTSPQPFIQIDEAAAAVMDANDRITAVYPRFQADIEINAGGDLGRGTMLALDPANDDIGFIDVVTGTYKLGNNQIAILEDTAYNYSLNVGDEIDVSYSFPLPREEGKPNTVGASERRTTHRFTIGSIVRQDGVANSEFRTGLIVGLADVQAWLGLPGQAQTLIATVDPALYETNNAEVAALRMLNITRDVQSRLGDDYTYAMDKATFLDQSAQGFMAAMALINVYGLMALGVVGLLVHTLVMTNVQEQKRDMAVLRILGGQRNFLFTLVIVEVLVIGAIGVGLGVVLGQLITQYIAVPLIQNQLAQQGLTTPLTPRVSLAAILPAVISAFVVLIISSVKPAQDAAQTKVMHAINPGVADNIQIEDLAKLRERSPNGRLFLSGIGLMFIFLLIAGFQTVEAFGGPALQVSFYLMALGFLILGLGLMFFITTVPFERLVLLVMRSVFPKVTYFARRNVGRGSLRNTLISLLVLFSGVLPSFLATQMALDNANFETSTRLNMGAPISIRVFQRWDSLEDISASRLKPSFLTSDLAAVPGIDQSVGLTYEYYNRASDAVGMRAASVGVIGINGRLNDVLFAEMMEFTAGGAASLDRILEEPNTVVISEGLAEYLAVSLGDKIKITGEGQDNVMTVQIVGIARRVPGFGDIVRSRTRAQGSSTVFMSLDSFRHLTTPLNDPLPPHDDPVFSRVLTTLTPEAVPEEVSREIGERFGTTYNMWTQLFETQLEMNAQAQATQRVFLLILTIISFTTAVFGVFAVIYVTIYARRIEIGMMKAMGMRRRDLTGMLIVESIAMTLGAALAGIAAGAAMGYVSYWGDRVLQERPMIFAVDTTVMPFIVIMVVLASILGAAFSARRIVKKQAVEILRMQ